MPHPHWVTRYYRSTWKARWDHPVYQKWSYAHSQGLAVLQSTPNLDPGSVTPALTYAAPSLGDKVLPQYVESPVGSSGLSKVELRPFSRPCRAPINTKLGPWLRHTSPDICRTLIG